MLTCLRIYTKKLTMLTKVTCTTRCLRGLQFYSPRSKLAMFTWDASLIMKNYIEKVEAWVLPPLYPTFPRPLLYIAYIAYIMISYVISTISHWKIWFSEKHARLHVQMKSWKWSSMHLTILALSRQKYVYSLVIKIYGIRICSNANRNRPRVFLLHNYVQMKSWKWTSVYLIYRQ